MQTDLTDEELIDTPLENLRPGELSRAFLVKAEHIKRKLEEEVSVHSTLTALQRRQEEEAHHEQDALQRREEILLASLHDREKAIFADAEALDARAIKLDDGRRAYVDRDKYRDAEGRELNGADRAQAEQHHLDQPHAATWQEHQYIEQRWQATKQLERKVEKLQDAKSDANATQALYGYEKEFQGRLAKREAELTNASASGSDDYMAALGLSGGFKQAVSGVGSNGPLASPGSPQPRGGPEAAPPAP